MDLRFDKYEGLGNDFIVVDVGHDSITGAVATRLCARHTGIGADGVLFTGVASGRPFMGVRNADGSTAEMCGNGVRCVALFLRDRGLVSQDRFVLDTDAGPHAVRVLPDRRVEVGMRPASLAPADLPLTSDRSWIDEPIEVARHALRVTAVSMGNPHAVTFDEVPRDVVGPALEVDPRFPERVNAGFATRTEAGLTLAVWERGVGWTRACGTGACAAAVAAVQTGRAVRGEDLRVTLPGGELVIRVGAPGEAILMTGPARRVFTGSLEL